MWYCIGFILTDATVLSSITTNQFPSGRNLPIDVFRGVTILLMIFVNELAGIADIPQWAQHMPADADALSFVDVVFPAFLFIVGLSLPFAVQARRTRRDSDLQVLTHGLVRALSLIIIGVFMVNSSSGLPGELTPISSDAWTLIMYVCVLLVWSGYPRNLSTKHVRAARSLGLVGLAWLWWIYAGEDGRGMTTQWWGILGLIGWAYALVLPVYLLSRRVSVHVIVLLSLTAAYFALENIGDESNILIRWLADNRGNFTHAAIVLAGVILTSIIYDEKYEARARLSSAVYCASAFLLALGTWQLAPISKIYATPSWGLFSIAICSVSFLLLQQILKRPGGTSWTSSLMPAANNPLVFYLIPYFVAALLGLLSWSPRPEFFDSGLPGVIWCVVFTIAIAMLGGILTRAGIRIRL